MLPQYWQEAITSVNTVPHFKAALSSWLYNQDEQLRF